MGEQLARGKSPFEKCAPRIVRRDEQGIRTPVLLFLTGQPGRVKCVGVSRNRLHPQPFNLSGQPAFSLPLAWSTSGLPIGMQLAGRRFGEATLVRLAAQLEAARPWVDRKPALAS